VEERKDNKSLVGKFRAKFVELYSRVVKLSGDKDISIFYNGANNLYPNEIELAILNSPSGKNASKMMAKYISGKGVTNDYIVNPDKNYKLSKITKIAASDISRQNGVFFHIGRTIGADLKLIKTLDILEYTKTRLGKEDVNEYVSKYWFKDFCLERDWRQSKSKDVWYYSYNDNEEVVMAQILADYEEHGGEKEDADLATMLPYYRGQVFYLNMTPEFKYALSPFDAVYNDLDSEYRISMYTNRQVRTGFLGKTYVVTTGLDDEESKAIKDGIQQWLGSDNSGGTFHLEAEQGTDIEKSFKIGQVKAEIDDKLFSETKTGVKDNIYASANNIPAQLVKSDTSIFGTQSETYIQMKKFYTEQTQDERKEIEDILEYLGFPCKIIPIMDISEITPSI